MVWEWNFNIILKEKRNWSRKAYRFVFCCCCDVGWFCSLLLSWIFVFVSESVSKMKCLRDEIRERHRFNAGHFIHTDTLNFQAIKSAKVFQAYSPHLNNANFDFRWVSLFSLKCLIRVHKRIKDFYAHKKHNTEHFQWKNSIFLHWKCRRLQILQPFDTWKYTLILT